MSLANLFGGLSQGFNTFMAMKQAQDEQNYRRRREGLEDDARQKTLQLAMDRETRDAANDRYRQNMDQYNAAANQLGAVGIHGLMPNMMNQSRDGNQVQTGTGAGIGGPNLVGNAMRSLALAQQQPNPTRGPIDLGGGLVADPKEKALQFERIGDRAGSYDPETGTTTVSDVRIPLSAEEQARLDLAKENAAASREYRQGALEDRQSARVQTGAQNFMSNNKELYNRASTLNQAMLTLQSTSPALYKSKLVNFLQAADPKAQIRLGTLQYFGNVDPSAHGQMSVITDKIMNGQYPPEVIKGLTDHLESLRQLNKSEWTAKRNWYTSRNHGSDQFIPDAETAFGTGETAPSGSSGGKKYTLPDGTVVE